MLEGEPAQSPSRMREGEAPAESRDSGTEARREPRPPQGPPSETGSQTLRQIVAEYFGVDAGQVGSEFSLSSGRGQGSVARASLDAMIRRRLGVQSAAVYSADTYGELETALAGGGGGALAPSTDGLAAPRPPLASGAPAASACGVDIEFLDNLPEADDYWEHPFYQANFSSREIAECLRQPSPRRHFAARWCAKEALKKCVPALLREPMNQLEYVLEGDGPPYLARLEAGREPVRLPVGVSVSHSDNLAAAVAVSVPVPPPAPVSEADSPSSPAPLPRRSGALAAVLALAALALAAWALVRTFH